MPELPTHPFKKKLPGDRPASTTLPALAAFRARASAFLINTSVVVEPDSELLRTELMAAPPVSPDQRLRLAQTTDPGLSVYGKNADPKTAWCIAELQYLYKTDRNCILESLNFEEATGLVAAFIANMELTAAETEEALLALCARGCDAQAIAAGSLLYRALERALIFGG